MSERLSVQLGIAVALVISLATITFAEHAVAQLNCPTGTVAIIASTRDAATAAGLPASVQCWNPSDPNTGTAAGDAKLWLEQHATKSANISCLSPQFAETLMTFMQAVPGGIPTITDGYRGQAAQNQAVAGGASKVGWCSSYHNYGMAADFNNSSSQTQQWMRLNAPKYGLAPTGVNPTTGCASSGFCDPGHIQMAGPLPPSNQCGICNSSGNGTLPAGAGAQTAPTNAASTIQRMFAPPQAAAPYAQPSAINPVTSSPVPTTQTQTGACSPQYICSNGTVYYQSASCTTSTFQICQYGCAGTVCAPAPANGTTSQPVQNTTVPTSALGLLEQFLSPVVPVSTSTATSAPVSLNSNIYTIVQGELGSQTQATSSASSSFEGTSGYEQQTLTGNPSATGYSNTGYSPLMSLFINLRVTLSNLLTYLQPFGGQVPAPLSSE